MCHWWCLIILAIILEIWRVRLEHSGFSLHLHFLPWSRPLPRTQDDSEKVCEQFCPRRPFSGHKASFGLRAGANSKAVLIHVDSSFPFTIWGSRSYAVTVIQTIHWYFSWSLVWIMSVCWCSSAAWLTLTLNQTDNTKYIMSKQEDQEAPSNYKMTNEQVYLARNSSNPSAKCEISVCVLGAAKNNYVRFLSGFNYCLALPAGDPGRYGLWPQLRRSRWVRS